MNRKKIKILADYVWNLPEDYEYFNMAFYGVFGKPAEMTKIFGTPGCFIGHGPAAGIKPKKFEEWEDYSERVTGLDILSQEWDWLFDEDWKRIDNTPKGAAQRAYYLLEHGLPKNWREQINGNAPLCYLNQEPV